jgi:hypothetical protein
MKRLVLLGLLATPVHAEMVSISGTPVTLKGTDRPGAIAEVVMHNVQRNDQPDEGDYPLAHNGLTVTVTFDWDSTMSGADRITVFVPEGYVADPEFIDVPEYGTGTIYIFSVDGVGM